MCSGYARYLIHSRTDGYSRMCACLSYPFSAATVTYSAHRAAFRHRERKKPVSWRRWLSSSRRVAASSSQSLLAAHAPLTPFAATVTRADSSFQQCIETTRDSIPPYERSTAEMRA